RAPEERELGQERGRAERAPVQARIGGIHRGVAQVGHGPARELDQVPSESFRGPAGLERRLLLAPRRMVAAARVQRIHEATGSAGIFEIVVVAAHRARQLEAAAREALTREPEPRETAPVALFARRARDVLTGRPRLAEHAAGLTALALEQVDGGVQAR